MFAPDKSCLRSLAIAIAILARAFAPHAGDVRADDAAAADKPALQAPVGEAEIARLIADLESPDYHARQAASQQLTQAGAAAVGALLDVSQKGSLEASVRALAALEAIYCDGAATDSNAAEAALETLARSKQPSVAIRAEVALSANESVTIEKIISNGGIFTNMKDERLTSEQLRALPRNEIILHLGKTWTGNDEGLRYVKRLEWLRAVRFVNKSNGVTDDGLAGLSAISGLQVHRRGAAKLGITAESHPEGCLVTQVSPGSGAAEANIQPGDLIVKFDGQSVKEFDRLIEIIAGKEPGNKVEFEYQRNMPGTAPTNLKGEVTLKGWIAAPGATPADGSEEKK